MAACFFCLDDMIYSITKDGVLLSVKVITNAGTSAIKDVVKDADGREFLRLTVVSVPEKGKANKEVIKLLSKELEVPKSVLSVETGETSHYKKILIQKNDDDSVNKLNKWSEHGGENC